MCSELKGREQYVSRVEEARRWLEYALDEKLPSVTEFESSISSGEVLGRVEKRFKKCFNIENEEKIYAKERKFIKLIKTKATPQAVKDFLNFVQATGLPKKLCPQSKPPKSVELVYCLHGLSHLLKCRGIVNRSVQDFSVEKDPLTYEKIKFAAQKVKGSGLAVIMPSFNIVGMVVEEEFQSMCISLSQESCSSEEDLTDDSTSCPVGGVSNTDTCLFDDPIYAQPMKKSRNHLSNHQKSLDDQMYDDCVRKSPVSTAPLIPRQPLIAELTCEVPDVTVKVLECPPIEQEPSLREGAIFVVNVAIDNGDKEALLAALRDHNAQLPYVHNNDEFAGNYLREFLKEKETHLPKSTICIYKGLSRDVCQTCMEKMAPGTFLVREVTNSEDDSLVISFRNQTVTKHWKVLLKDGQYCLSDTDRFSEFSDFIQHFSATLRQETKLHIHPATSPSLHPQNWKNVPRLAQLAEEGNSLSYEQIKAVVNRVNSHILKDRKMSREVVRKSLVYFSWTEDMMMNVSRAAAEKLLLEHGKSGHFLVRPSQDADAFAISFRTSPESSVVHWKVTREGGKYTIHPRPHKYNNLQEVVVTFAQNVYDKTGVQMKLPSFPERIRREVGTESSLQSSNQQQGSEGNGMRNTCGVGSPINQNPNCRSTLNPSNVASWSEGDVSQWLVQVELEEFRERFESNAIDGECLLSLDLLQLKEDLNILPLGHRHRILRQINILRDRCGR